MDIEEIRAHCLSFPHATEDLKPEWGDALLFRIAGKIFVSIGLGDVPVRMNVKCTPERCAELLEVEGVRRADYSGRYDWITFTIAGVFRDTEVRELIGESYANIRAKLPKSTVAKLAAAKPNLRRPTPTRGRRATQ
jgi:predicted DNA-binding protein (MmcQ/YjbR family)